MLVACHGSRQPKIGVGVNSDSVLPLSFLPPSLLSLSSFFGNGALGTGLAMTPATRARETRAAVKCMFVC